MNLAFHTGVIRIVLLGYDMCQVDGKSNWHGDHPNSNNPYRIFLKAFDAIKKDADELGIVILNATPGSALTLFPIVDLEDII